MSVAAPLPEGRVVVVEVGLWLYIRADARALDWLYRQTQARAGAAAEQACKFTPLGAGLLAWWGGGVA